MSTLSRGASAILRNEFLQMFQKCTPPTGWPEAIAVANSGGPDSTCLLFLIHRLLSHPHNASSPTPTPPTKTSPLSFPRRVVSLTIDHDLQTSSSSMAEHCARNAQALGIEHITTKVPWSQAPFPARPGPDESFEDKARLARYHLLLDGMKRTRTDSIAFGHHADDQVETMLMRLGRGTTEIGAGGMRACRRWGMGFGEGEGNLGWAGHDGLKKWIVRPLLTVEKDRILATCESHNLEYLTDKTNFQPDLTIRNAIRSVIQSPNNQLESIAATLLPEDISNHIQKIEKALSTLESVSIDLSSGPEQLRGAVQMLTGQVEDIDNQVDSALNRAILPSPPGTCFVSSRALSSIRDPLVRTGVVLRIMRYVSFHPWGSTRADGNRRRSSLAQLTRKLWDPNPFASGLKMFVAGGGVLWTPVAVRGSSIKTPDRVSASGMGPGDIIGWLASRQPPLHRRKLVERGLTDPLELDVTAFLASRISEASHYPRTREVLYDNRFLLCFNMDLMPENISMMLRKSWGGKILIKPHTRWYWPQVVHVQFREEKVLHSLVPPENHKAILEDTLDAGIDHTKYWRPRTPPIDSGWITVKWIRPIGAV